MLQLHNKRERALEAHHGGFQLDEGRVRRSHLKVVLELLNHPYVLVSAHIKSWGVKFAPRKHGPFLDSLAMLLVDIVDLIVHFVLLDHISQSLIVRNLQVEKCFRKHIFILNNFESSAHILALRQHFTAFFKGTIA